MRLSACLLHRGLSLVAIETEQTFLSLITEGAHTTAEILQRVCSLFGCAKAHVATSEQGFDTSKPLGVVLFVVRLVA